MIDRASRIPADPGSRSRGIVPFDIDGTLVSCGGAGRKALELAFHARYGVADALRGIVLSGNTDLQIAASMFELALGREPGPGEIDALLLAYLEQLPATLEAARAATVVFPGVVALLEALGASAQHTVGLATGNVERGARLKLGATGLDGHFRVGGYGSDAKLRTEIVRRAIDRALALHGAAVDPRQIWVIGDTARDVVAAREAGVRSIGVLAGSLVQSELRASAPDLLVERMDDPAVFTALQLPSLRNDTPRSR